MDTENRFVTDKSTQLWIVISVAFCSFMSRLNNYIVNISLPTIAEYFNIGTGEVSRVVVVYLLIITSTLLLFGRLADKIGLKRIFIAGYSLFVIGSMLCGFSHNIHVLVAFRCVQAIGSAMLLASGYAMNQPLDTATAHALESSRQAIQLPAKLSTLKAAFTVHSRDLTRS